MVLSDITPLILTCNEEANIERALAAIPWATQVMVVDSGSSDRTVELACRDSRVIVSRRDFDDHTSQWNFGLDQVRSRWVLTLDADYRCPDAFADELKQLAADDSVYLADFQYCVFEKPLRGTLYPSRAVLFQTDKFRFKADGHTQQLDLNGTLPARLRTRLLHDDRKPLSRWCQSQLKYAELEAEKLTETSHDKLGWKDRLRKWIVVAPPLTLLYCLFWKGLILDGWRGVFYTLQRVYAELLLSLVLLDRKLRAASGEQRERKAESGGREESERRGSGAT